MSKPVECPTLSEIDSLVRRAIDYNEVDLLVKMIHQFYSDYHDLAILCTDGHYGEKWTHQDVVTYYTFHN